MKFLYLNNASLFFKLCRLVLLSSFVFKRFFLVCFHSFLAHPSPSQKSTPVLAFLSRLLLLIFCAYFLPFTSAHQTTAHKKIYNSHPNDMREYFFNLFPPFSASQHPPGDSLPVPASPPAWIDLLLAHIYILSIYF